MTRLYNVIHFLEKLDLRCVQTVNVLTSLHMCVQAGQCVHSLFAGIILIDMGCNEDELCWLWKMGYFCGCPIRAYGIMHVWVGQVYFMMLMHLVNQMVHLKHGYYLKIELYVPKLTLLSFDYKASGWWSGDHMVTSLSPAGDKLLSEAKWGTSLHRALHIHPPIHLI